MASFSTETGFDYRTIDFTEFASPDAVKQFTPANLSGLPFDIYTQGLYGIDGGQRVSLAGDLDFDGTSVSGSAFLFLKQSTDTAGNWLDDFRITDVSINAFNVSFMINSTNPLYTQSLFMLMFLGNDVAQLSPFADAFDGFYGDDALYGYGGNDLLLGNEGNDRLEGGEGRDQLFGGNGRDTLLGDWEADKLTGGRGADLLIGGGGADRFIYNSRGEGHDTIIDFQSIDTLAFKASAFGGLPTGELDASHFVSRAADHLAQDADDRFIYDESARELWFDRNGSADGGLHLIARFSGLPMLTAADILLF